MKKLTLGVKITLASILAVFFSSIISLIIQNHQVTKSVEESTKDRMKIILQEGEAARAATSALWKKGAFDKARLLEDLKTRKDYHDAVIYNTVPVVAAWNAIRPVAESEGFTFHVPADEPRNKDNAPSSEEREILRYFANESNEEYFKVDRENKKITYARPIRLSADCLGCHGDPANSPTGDGKDILGFKMENWIEGQLHGTFVLTSDFKMLDANIREGSVNAAISSFFILLIVAIVFYFLNRRMIVLPLNQAIDSINGASIQTNGASQEISNASHQLAEGASRQAAAIEETSASIEELTSMTKTTTENAQGAQGLAEETRLKAESGSQEMQEMTIAVQSIKSASDDIAKIIKSIDEIAFQTNILALNAAVEAARAGEAGAGFSVVAEEVRNLAQRSAIAARETSDKIAESIQRSNRGVEISTRVSKTFQEIVERIRLIDQTISQIASASKEQSTGIGQINSAISELDKTTQSNAASSEELAAAAQELSAQANSLQDSIQDLSSLVGVNIEPSPIQVRIPKSNDGDFFSDSHHPKRLK